MESHESDREREREREKPQNRGAIGSRGSFDRWSVTVSVNNDHCTYRVRGSLESPLEIISGHKSLPFHFKPTPRSLSFSSPCARSFACFLPRNVLLFIHHHHPRLPLFSLFSIIRLYRHREMSVSRVCVLVICCIVHIYATTFMSVTGRFRFTSVTAEFMYIAGTAKGPLHQSKSHPLRVSLSRPRPLSFSLCDKILMVIYSSTWNSLRDRLLILGFVLALWSDPSRRKKQERENAPELCLCEHSTGYRCTSQFRTTLYCLFIYVCVDTRWLSFSTLLLYSVNKIPSLTCCCCRYPTQAYSVWHEKWLGSIFNYL